MGWTCKRCSSEGVSRRRIKSGADAFSELWKKRYNPNLVLIDDYVSSYKRIRVRCRKHPERKNLGFIGNGKKYMWHGICVQCHNELRLRDLQAKHGKQYTSVQQLPEVKRKKEQTSLRRYGVRHYMQNPEKFEEQQKRLFKGRRIRDPRLKGITSDGSLFVRGLEDLAVLELLERYKGQIEYMSSSPMDMPPIWYDTRRGRRRYYPDLVVVFKDGSRTLYEVKGDLTLWGSYDILERNRLKFRAAKQWSSKRGVDFKLIYFGGKYPRREPEMRMTSKVLEVVQ